MTTGIEDLRRALIEAARLDGLAQAERVIDSTYSFLLGEGFSRDELRPMFRLLAAVADHRLGKEHPMLAVRRVGNRDYIADSEFKAAVAATMAIWIRGGVKKQIAAETIAVRLREAGVKASGKAVDGWHREISHKRKDGHDAYLAYIAAAGDHPGAAAEGMLATLTTLAREKL